MTADLNPLTGELEHKFNARGVGVVKEEPADGSEVTELVRVTRDRSQARPGCR